MTKPILIAEISSNHNSELERALEMIRVAANLGFDAVKFQLFKIDKLFSKEILDKSKLHRQRKNWELPLEFVYKLSDLSRSLGLKFGCTPFYLEAVCELEPYVDFYKISSYEILWLKLFEVCCNTGKPIIFSTGMANIQEIKNVLAIVSKGKTKDITLLKCTSEYPCKPENVYLKSLETLKKITRTFNPSIKIGLSDHTRSLGVILRAIHRYEVNAVELHIDLDKKGVEFKPGHCWLPEEIKLLVELVTDGQKADGTVYLGPTESEKKERLWRSDPIDGLRPLIEIRENFSSNE
tara:strand:- start:1738 stop:2619 length:882 start_codon:yes stop_codon:yes gene_type:complete